MIIGDRLRDLRQKKNLSQGDIERRTGLLRCYISRVENGYTIPAIETLERLAQALQIPLYQLFYEGNQPIQAPVSLKGRARDESWGSSGKHAVYLRKLRNCLGKSNEDGRRLVLSLAQRVAARHSARD